MNRWTAVRMAVFAGVCALGSAADAQPVLSQRCSADGLGPSRSVARLEWARKCALTKLLPSDHVNGEYIEPTPDPYWGQNAYSGPGDLREINNTYLNNLYRPGETTFFIDADGYYKWGRPDARRKPRPLYPVYGTQADVTAATQLFPHPNHATCGFYYDRNGTQPANVSFYVNGFCEANGTEITSGTPRIVSGDTGSTTTYALEVPPGANGVLFETSGGTGDVDLYVRPGAPPTLTEYLCRPYRSGNTEACDTRSPAAGTWYVMLRGYAAYAGVTLKATVY